MTSEQERELLEWLGIPQDMTFEAQVSFAIIEKMREKWYGYWLDGQATDAKHFAEFASPYRVKSAPSARGETLHAAIKQAAYNAMREERK